MCWRSDGKYQQTIKSSGYPIKESIQGTFEDFLAGKYHNYNCF